MRAVGRRRELWGFEERRGRSTLRRTSATASANSPTERPPSPSVSPAIKACRICSMLFARSSSSHLRRRPSSMAGCAHSSIAAISFSDALR